MALTNNYVHFLRIKEMLLLLRLRIDQDFLCLVSCSRWCSLRWELIKICCSFSADCLSLSLCRFLSLASLHNRSVSSGRMQIEGIDPLVQQCRRRSQHIDAVWTLSPTSISDRSRLQPLVDAETKQATERGNPSIPLRMFLTQHSPILAADHRP